MSGLLTSPEFIRKLEMLSLLTRKVLGGDLKADRKSWKKGSGINFADYTEYHYGDDYRNIDWNIYARLEDLVIKLYELEEDVRICIFLDLSPSMKSKIIYTKQLAAALGYIALNHLDRLEIGGLSDKLSTILQPSHGRNKIFPMLRALEVAEIYGTDTNLTNCIRTFQSAKRRPGVCVIISDFFIPGGYQKALDYLLWLKHDVFCLQVVDPSEQGCSWRGDIEFECVESGRLRQVTVGPMEAARFARAVAEWNDQLKRECARKGVGLVTSQIDVPFETVIRNILRRGGLVA